MRLDARWAGPALVMLGLAGIAVLSLEPPGHRSTLGWWIFSSALAYEHILPLIGLGAALALVSLRYRIAAFALFSLGIALGLMFAASFVSAVALIPGAVTHHFLTGPISSTAVGLSLAVPRWVRGWALPVVSAMIAGAMCAVAIRVTDPNVQDPVIARVGIAVALWILTAVCLTASAFLQSWFETAGRILGSWLIAIGLLYGGASIIPPRRLSPPPQLPSSPLSRDELIGPGRNKAFPELDQSSRRRLPDGFDPSRHP